MKFTAGLCALLFALARVAAADPALDQALVDAAKAGDLAKVQSLLGQGAQLNFLHTQTDAECSDNYYNNYSPALREAVRGGFPSVVEALLKAGAATQTQIKEFGSCSPLLIAVTRSQSLDLLKLFVAYKADLNILESGTDYDVPGYSAIWWASALGDIDEVNLLIGAGAKLDTVASLGVTDPVLSSEALPVASPLGAALWFKKVDAFQALLAAGATASNVFEGQLATAYIAAYQGDLASLQALAQHGANLNQRVDLTYESPLSIAIQQKHQDVIAYLFSQSVDVGTVTNCVHPADLLVAAQADDLATVKKLLAAGVMADAGIGTGCLPGWPISHPALLDAVTDGYEDIAGALLDAHANANFTLNGQSLLMTAADSTSPEAVAIAQLLISHGANVNQDDGLNYGQTGTCNPSCRRTALTHAVVLDHLDVANALLAAGANPNVLDYIMADSTYLSRVAGSPLLWSAQLGFLDVLKALLDKNADVTVVDDEGQNALMRALTIPSADTFAGIAQALVGKSLDIKALDGVGATALHILLLPPTLPPQVDQRVKALLSLGADPNAKTPFGSTPLMYASGLSGGSGDLATVELLLSKRADPRLRNQSGFAAADYAHQLGLNDIETALCAAASDVCQSFKPVPRERLGGLQ